MIAMKHDLTVPEEHFERANRSGPDVEPASVFASAPVPVHDGADVKADSDPAMQNPVQQPAAIRRKHSCP